MGKAETAKEYKEKGVVLKCERCGPITTLIDWEYVKANGPCINCGGKFFIAGDIRIKAPNELLAKVGAELDIAQSRYVSNES